MSRLYTDYNSPKFAPDTDVNSPTFTPSDAQLSAAFAKAKELGLKVMFALYLDPTIELAWKCKYTGVILFPREETKMTSLNTLHIKRGVRLSSNVHTNCIVFLTREGFRERAEKEIVSCVFIGIEITTHLWGVPKKSSKNWSLFIVLFFFIR